MKVLIKKDPRYPLDLKKIRQKAKEILASFGLSDKVELSLYFIGTRKAKELNQTYRKMDYIPEVLSFSMNEKGPDGVLRLGDLVICFPKARDLAMKRNRMVEEIIAELLEHGIKNLVAVKLTVGFINS